METRTLTGVETKGRTISGYAIVFNQKSEVLREGGRKFREVILPGAITPAVINQSDVRAYIDHDSSRLVARSNKGKGSLHLSIDAKGLRFSFLAPKTAEGDFAVEMIARGDLTGCSFAFSDVEDTWTEESGGIYLRKIKKIGSLHDVSIVQTPAYPQTTVGVRNKEKNSKDMEKRSIQDILPNWADIFRSEVSAKLLQDKVNVKVETSARGCAAYPFLQGATPTIDKIPVQGAGDASIRIKKAEPKRIYSKIDLSSSAVNENPALLEGGIREVARITARTINKWILSPTKIVDVDGVKGVFIKDQGDVLPFAGEVPTWAEIVQLETSTLSTAQDETGLYVVSPLMAQSLKTTPKATGTDMMMANGQMNGYPVYVTTDVPDGFVGFGFFSNIVVNEFDSLTILKDTILRAIDFVTVIHCNYETDVAVLRDKAFAVGYTPSAYTVVFG